MPTSKLRSALIALALIVVAGLANLGLSLALEPYGTITELIWSQYRALEQAVVDEFKNDLEHLEDLLGGPED